MFSYALATEFKVFSVIERVKVAYGSRAVLFEKFSVQVNQLPAACVKGYGIYSPCKCLQIRLFADNGSKFIHHHKGIFVKVEIKALKSRPSAKLKVRYASFFCRLHSGKKVLHKHPSTINRLKAVPKTRIHNVDEFFCHSRPLKKFWLLYPKFSFNLFII